MLVSFQLASKYPERLLGLLDSLQNKARHPSNFEVLVKIDIEDEAYVEWIAREQRRRPFPLRYIATPRLGGYPDLWIALNDLFQQTDPACYFVNAINDELRVREEGWDDILARYKHLYPDDIYRLRTSVLRLRNYVDLWECGYAPENYAFFTRRWIEITEGWNPCFGPDSSQQYIAYYLARANLPSHHQFIRDIPILDINWENEGASLDLSGDAARNRHWQNTRTWFRIVSHPMQEELKRRALLLQANILAEGTNLKISDDRRHKAIVLVSPDDELQHILRYAIPRLRHRLANLRRSLQYHCYAGGGYAAWKAQPFALIDTLRAYSPRFWWYTQSLVNKDWYRRLESSWKVRFWDLRTGDGRVRRWHRYGGRLGRLRRYLTTQRLSRITPLSSGANQGANHTFDRNTNQFWISPEHGEEVAGNAWIGLDAGEPMRVTRLRLVQTSNPPFRQDRVDVEVAEQPEGPWRRVLPAPVDTPEDIRDIFIKDSVVARCWRLVAAGNNARLPEHAWTPLRIEVFVHRQGLRFIPLGRRGAALLQRLKLTRLNRLTPLSSGANQGANHIFERAAQTFWVSPENGEQVAGNSWIGFEASQPVRVARLVLRQTNNHPFRQDRVRIETAERPDGPWRNLLEANTPNDVSRIELRGDVAANCWRLVAAADNARLPEHAWTPFHLDVFVRRQAMLLGQLRVLVRPLWRRLRTARLKRLTPLSSGANQGANHVFDHDTQTFWISPEQGTQVAGNSWIGFAARNAVQVIALVLHQTNNPPFRQDRVRIEVADRPEGPWRELLVADTMSDVTRIALPGDVRAACWRLVAAGDNAKLPEHSWTPFHLAVFVRRQGIRLRLGVPWRRVLRRLRTTSLKRLTPLSSGANQGANHVFERGAETFWVSPENGTGVAGNSWIGFAARHPVRVTSLILTQTNNPPFRQDRVRLDVADEPDGPWRELRTVDMSYDVSSIELPGDVSAACWRLVAAGDNAQLPEHAWTPFHLEVRVRRQIVMPHWSGRVWQRVLRRMRTVRLKRLTPLSSGASQGANHLFERDALTFWVSPERGMEVAGNAWIGFAATRPVRVTGLALTQTNNRPFRQDRVRLEIADHPEGPWWGLLSFETPDDISRIELPGEVAAPCWRLVAIGDNARLPEHSWTPFHLDVFVRRQKPLVEVGRQLRRIGRRLGSRRLIQLTPLSSGASQGANHLFEGDASAFWVSPEHGTGVAGNSWIGFAALQSVAVTALVLTQTNNAPFRQDRVSLEVADQPEGPWRKVLLADTPHDVSPIELPGNVSARCWRLVAAADNARQPEHSWTPLHLDVFIYRRFLRLEWPRQLWRVAQHRLRNARLRRLTPLSSGANQGANRIFNRQTQKFWISPESGKDVTGKAWIGFATSRPVSVTTLTLAQTNNRPFRQDRVRVEAADQPEGPWRKLVSAETTADISRIALPGEVSARCWRVVAAGDNARLPEHAWTPLYLEVFVRRRGGLRS